MIEIVSIHIPKTAGRSFLSILNSVYESNTVAHFDRKNYSDKKTSEVEQFKSQLDEKTKVIHGHFQYKEISDLKNISSAKVITWFRNPIERVISNYSFFKKRISESLNDPELQRRKTEKLVEYASLENSRNRMSKFIDGLDIENFYFIGLKENFSNDIHVLAEMLEWKPFQVPRINDNAEFKSQMPNVSNEEKKIIEELNSIDMELYNTVLKLHNKRNN